MTNDDDDGNDDDDADFDQDDDGYDDHPAPHARTAAAIIVDFCSY